LVFPFELFDAAQGVGAKAGKELLATPPTACYALTERSITRIERSLEVMQQRKVSVVAFADTVRFQVPVPAKLIEPTDVSRITGVLAERLRTEMRSLVTDGKVVNLIVEAALDDYFDGNPPTKMRLRGEQHKDRAVTRDEFSEIVQGIVRKALRVPSQDLRYTLALVFGDKAVFEGLQEFFA
jgi:hypothetical protein